jgi:hypothetical protein
MNIRESLDKNNAKRIEIEFLVLESERKAISH